MIAVAWVAAAAIFSSITAPIILTIFATHQRRADKREEWARQDQIAGRLAQHNDHVSGQLGEIKELVNGNLSEAMHGECEATIAQLAVMRQLAELSRAQGIAPPAALKREIDAVEKRAARLRAKCALRPYDRGSPL